MQFIFAGTGPLEETVNGIKNIKNVGFQKGEALEKLIREARFSIYPSEWYENCPFSVMESQMYGTPVLGAEIGGIPELIQVGKTGELFKSGKPEEEISIETIKKLPKMYFTNITGGEPFIRTDLKDIVRELYKKSDRIVISTNLSIGKKGGLLKISEVVRHLAAQHRL